MNFYKVVLVMEADDYLKAETLAKQLVDEDCKSYDIWLKTVAEMTNEEIFEFFERTKEEMEGENE